MDHTDPPQADRLPEYDRIRRFGDGRSVVGGASGKSCRGVYSSRRRFVPHLPPRRSDHGSLRRIEQTGGTRLEVYETGSGIAATSAGIQGKVGKSVAPREARFRGNARKTFTKTLGIRRAGARGCFGSG